MTKYNMYYFEAIIFGIVQGITEFLPISSSGHLLILHKLIDTRFAQELTFDVILHFASVLAVIIFFRQEIWQLTRSFFNGFVGKADKYTKVAWLLFLGSIPAALAGYFLEDIIDNNLRSLYVIVVTLIIGGILFLMSEHFGKKDGEMINIGWKKVLVIGFAQALALIPGTSRSGITVVAGLFLGLKRSEAVKFSFLLSIPIILGAAIVQVPKINLNILSIPEINFLSISFIASFISAFLTIRFFLKFVQKYSLKVFAYYRFILAFIILIIITI